MRIIRILSMMVIFSLTVAGCGSHYPTAKSSGLMDSFTLKEITENNQGIPIQNSSVSPVDINSSITVEVHPESFPSIEVSKFRPLPDITKQREKLIETLKQIDEYIAISKSIQDSFFETHDKLGRALTDKQNALAIFRQKQAQQAQLGIKILETVEEYIELVKVDPSKPDAVDEWMKSHKVDLIKNKEFAEFVKQEINAIKLETQSRENAILDSASKVKLRLQARLFSNGGMPAYFHVPGYDNLDAGDPHLVEKLSVQLSEQEKTELGKEVEFSARFANVYNDIRKNGADLKTALLKEAENLRTALKKEVAAAQEDLNKEQIWTSAEFIKRLNAIGQKFADQKNTDKKKIADEIKNDLDSLKSQVQSLKEKIENLKQLAAAPTDASPQLLVNLLQGDSNQVIQTMREITAILDLNDSTAIPGLVKKLKTDAQKDLDVKKEITDAYKQVFSQEFDTAFDKLGQVIDVIKALINGMSDFKKKTQENRLAEVANDPMSIDVPLSQVQNTELQIIRTGRREGDIVVMDAKVVSDDDKGIIVAEGSRIFKITKYGLYSKVSGNVIFVDQRKSDSNFVAAPAVSYIAHYRRREEDGWDRTWNALDPGLGINTALLNFQGAGTELGVGVTLSLFG